MDPSSIGGRRGMEARGPLHKLLFIMRLTAIFILSASLTVSAKGFSQITISEKNVPLHKIFTQIRQQTGVNFLYDYDLLLQAGDVSVKLKDASLADALNAILIEKKLTWELQDKTVVIKPKQQMIVAVDPSQLPLPLEIHGRIVNEQGEPITGASVKIKGTDIGTTTDAGGAFTLKDVDEKAILVISGTDIETFEQKIGGKTAFLLKAKIKVQDLNEVVINKGYYSTTQALNTGNVYRVDGKELAKQPVLDPIKALQGKVPGMFINESSGIPGSNNSIQLRGQNGLIYSTGKSITANDPLFIIDGVPFGSTTLSSSLSAGQGQYSAIYNNQRGGSPSGRNGLSPFSILNSADIESIEVLKDADATSIYGSRGANGVVLITTKRGLSGKTKVSAGFKSGWQHIIRYFDMLDTRQYLDLRNEYFRNTQVFYPNVRPLSGSDPDLLIWDTTRYTDWQKILIGNTAHSSDINLSVSGGNSNTQFLISGSYNKQGTVFPGNYSNTRITGNVSITHTSDNKKLKLLFNTVYGNGINDIPREDFTKYIFLPPNAPKLYNENGSFNWEIINGRNSWDNPMARTANKARSLLDNITSNIQISYQLLPGLKLSENLGYTISRMEEKSLAFSTSASPTVFNPNYARQNFSSNNKSANWSSETLLTYSRNFGNINLEAMAGSTLQEEIMRFKGQEVDGFINDALVTNPSAASFIGIPNLSYSQFRYNAFFGRIGLNYQQKYIVNLTARRDGSSRFGPEKKFGNFGSVGGAWIFSRERIFANGALPWLSFGKLQASYGVTGNGNIGDYQYVERYGIKNQSYQNSTTLSPVGIANPYYAWEQVRKLEIGISLGFFHDKINVSGSYYRNRTGNQLLSQSLPAIAGFGGVTENLPALIQNTGIEITLQTTNITVGELSWLTGLNVSLPRNKLLKFPNFEKSAYTNVYAVGRPISGNLMNHYTGVDPQTGLYTFASKSGDMNSLDYINDRYFRVSTQNFFGGLNNSFSWKGLSLDIFFSFVKQEGTSILAFFNSTPGQSRVNQSTSILRRWQKPGDITDIQGVGIGGSDFSYRQGNFQSSDGVIVDASFIRLQNASISYQIPAGLTKQVRIDNARIFLQGQNLATFTKYEGLDPGTQSWGLPPLRTIVVGANFTF